MMQQTTAGPREKEEWGKRLREVSILPYLDRYAQSCQSHALHSLAVMLLAVLPQACCVLQSLDMYILQLCCVMPQELQALIKYIQQNKATDSDWFTITSNKEGTKWNGRCWYIHNLLKYEFAFEFDVPATYPATAPEIRIPELDGKTAKMYRGGAICLTVHFKPLWAKNRYSF